LPLRAPYVVNQFLLEEEGRKRKLRREHAPEHLQRFERHFDGAVGGIEDGTGAVLQKGEGREKGRKRRSVE
jgi:hypothetical protein